MGLALEVGILADLRDNDEEGFGYYTGQFADSQVEGATTRERYGIEVLLMRLSDASLQEVDCVGSRNCVVLRNHDEN